MPGLIDSHAHFIYGGFQLLSVDLKDARREEEFSRRIAEKAKTLAPGRWLKGGEWDEQAWPSAKLPTRQMIDAVTAKHIPSSSAATTGTRCWRIPWHSSWPE